MASRASVRRRPPSAGGHRVTRPTLAREDRRDHRADDATPDDDLDGPIGDAPATTVDATLARVARAVDAAVALDPSPGSGREVARRPFDDP